MTRRRKPPEWVEISTVGLTFPFAIGAGYLLGRWGDQWLGTHPWLTWIGAGFGIAAAFINLFRLAGGDEPADSDERDRDQTT